jgi:uncharacterized protein
MQLTFEQGSAAVHYAREALLSHFLGRKPIMPNGLEGVADQRRGVFVTLRRGSALRGCIGFPEPVLPLALALEKASLSASFDDPRFRPVSRDEADFLTFEVSVLTKPELIKAASPIEYEGKIRIGVDGLIARRGMASGLLLPQVPVEQKWSPPEYLMHVCAKAGLMPDEYMKKGFSLYRFQAQIFAEEMPGGEIVERRLSPNR